MGSPMRFVITSIWLTWYLLNAVKLYAFKLVVVLHPACVPKHTVEIVVGQIFYHIKFVSEVVDGMEEDDFDADQDDLFFFR